MEFKGKTLSLGAKLFSSIFVVVGFILLVVFLGKDLKIEHVGCLLAVGGFVVLIFLPVDVSLWLEKAIAIAEAKFGIKAEGGK